MPSIKLANESTFTFHSDIPISSQKSHKSGILHATKEEEEVVSNSDHGEEEQEQQQALFAWLDDRTQSNAANVISHLCQCGYEEERMVFIPYSSRENWMRCYPHASPNSEDLDPDASSISHRPTKKQKRSNATKTSLLPNTNLDDLERSQLHIEVYKYFFWLHTHLAELETTETGRNRIRREGISVPGLQNLVSKFESTFKNVGEYKVKHNSEDGDEGEIETSDNGKNNGSENDESDADANNGSEKENTPPQKLPLLERRMKEDLKNIVEEQEKSNSNTASAQDKPPTMHATFDQMYQCLLAFKEQNGHANVPGKHWDGHIHLGRWVGDIRRTRKKGLVSEEQEIVAPVEEEVISLPVSPGKLGLALEFPESPDDGGFCVITGIDAKCPFKKWIKVGDRLLTIDGVTVSKAEDLGVGKKKAVRNFTFSVSKKTPKVNVNDKLRLTPERVERLDSIGFQWSLGHETKPWDEKLALLIQYKEEHGQWPPQKEKWGGVGVWAHNQRAYYAQKNKKFMETKAPKLDAIGFPWSFKKTEILSWEDHFLKLVEFHRVNRHFDVPCPEGASGEKDEENVEIAEALKFHRWVRKLQADHHAFQNGKKTHLNQDRVNRLLDLGFEFRNLEGPTKVQATVPDIPFEVRLGQMQKCKAEFGHLNIDFRYQKMDNLGGWCAEISKCYKEWQEGNPISPTQEHQFNQLSDLGFEFNVFPEARSRRSWEENFNAFLEFQQVQGHSKVPHFCKVDTRLGIWAAMQRDEYKRVMEGKKSKLTPERIDKLNAVGFLWETGRRSSKK